MNISGWKRFNVSKTASCCNGCVLDFIDFCTEIFFLISFYRESRRELENRTERESKREREEEDGYEKKRSKDRC